MTNHWICSCTWLAASGAGSNQPEGHFNGFATQMKLPTSCHPAKFLQSMPFLILYPLVVKSHASSSDDVCSFCTLSVNGSENSLKAAHSLWSILALFSFSCCLSSFNKCRRWDIQKLGENTFSSSSWLLNLIGFQGSCWASINQYWHSHGLEPISLLFGLVSVLLDSPPALSVVKYFTYCPSLLGIQGTPLVYLD